MSRYTYEMRLAMRKTCDAYNKLINDPLSCIDGWRANYGHASSCRLCKASMHGPIAPSSAGSNRQCDNCPLDYINGDPIDEYGLNCTRGGEYHKFVRLLRDNAAADSVVQVAKTRLAWLIEQFDRECPGWRDEE